MAAEKVISRRDIIYRYYLMTKQTWKGGEVVVYFGMETLQSDQLVKYYRKRAVVDGVSIQVHPGEVVGLLGPNGAGKTTTFYMMIGFIRPDGGEVFLGERPRFSAK